MSDATSVLPVQLLKYVVRPALEAIGLPGVPSEMLVMGTAAQESGFAAIAQIGGGPALSMWQLEPKTVRDVVHRCTRPQLDGVVASICTISDFHDDSPVHGLEGLERIAELAVTSVVGNLFLGAALCRLRYYLSPFRIPLIGGVEVLHMESAAFLWKKYYNTSAGAGTEAEFCANWKRFNLDRLWSKEANNQEGAPQ